MSVDVDNEGVVEVEGAENINVTRLDNTVSFTIEFNTPEEAKRYYNIMCASVDVRCIHVHLPPMQDEDQGRTH